MRMRRYGCGCWRRLEENVGKGRDRGELSSGSNSVVIWARSLSRLAMN